MARLTSILAKIRGVLVRASIIANARYQDDVLDLQAMSLTYSTLLSLVPLLAVMFSVLKAFGIQNALGPFLTQMLQPLGANASEITSRVIHFVNNLRVGILGAAGVAMLFYTVVMLIAKIEDALNRIWRLPRSRSWGQRISAYLSVVLVGPVMVFSALTLTASAQSYWLVERLVQIGLVSDILTLATSVMPFILFCIAFTFLYKLLPFTYVRLSSALIGGATAGVLWQLIGIIFAAFVANSTRYEAIYSGFAIIIVFLIWLYVGWLIFLIGAEVAYFHQHPAAFVREGLSGNKSHHFKEWLALSALVEITRRHLSQEPPWRSIDLASHLGVSNLEGLFDEFIRAGILLKSADPEGVALARSPDDITVKDILDRVGHSNASTLVSAGPAARVLMRRDQAVQKALEGTTLRSLAGEITSSSAKFPQPISHVR